MERSLINYNKNKVWKASVKEAILYTETGKVGGKMRKTEKSFANYDLAVGEMKKKVWAKIKSGFVYYNENAAKGEPSMHYYIARAYTGSLPVTKVGDHALVAEHGDGFEESLILVSRDGHLVERIKAPKGMVMQMLYSEKHSTVFVRVDHKIFVGDLKTGKYKLICGYQKQPASFISLSENEDYLAWGTAPKVGVWDVAAKQNIFSQTLPAAYKVGGHTTVMTGAITNDKKFFVSSTKGACRVWDLATPTKYTVAKGDFEGLRDVTIVDKGQQTLVMAEHYGDWHLKFFDMNKAEFCEPPVNIPYSSTNLLSYAFSPKGNYFAMSQRGEVVIFDWNTKQLAQKIRLEHYIKRVDIAFIDENTLAARTDYGCLSLYNLS